VYAKLQIKKKLDSHLCMVEC